jgi:hypothetical protein
VDLIITAAVAVLFGSIAVYFAHQARKADERADRAEADAAAWCDELNSSKRGVA